MKGIHVVELDSVSSTNSFLARYEPPEGTDIALVTTEYQTAGRGQQGNTWESERGQNLLFSLMVRPVALPAARVFVLSEAIALSIREAVGECIGMLSPVRVKWPNDIYYGDCKIAGILIENTLTGQHVGRCIIGCGVNVLQREFQFSGQRKDMELHPRRLPSKEGAPMPTSLARILKQNLNPNLRQDLLEAIVESFRRRYAAIQDGRYAAIHEEYLANLYRREGLHTYSDANGVFRAAIAGVEADGHLLLRDTEGGLRRYAFKEVSYEFLSPPNLGTRPHRQ